MFSKGKQSNKVLEAIWRRVVHKVYTDVYVIALGGLSINNIDSFEEGEGVKGSESEFSLNLPKDRN